MPRTKKIETAAAEVKAEEVKETVAETPAVAEKPAKKTAAKKAPAKKMAPAKTATKATKTAAASKEVVKVQFGGDEFDLAEIKKVVEADYKGKFKGKVKTVEIYFKPEEKAVYYVINGDFNDKIEL